MFKVKHKIQPTWNDVMRIGEIARLSQLPSSTIRFYEKQGLLPNVRRTSAGYRVYDENILQRIQFIKIGQMLGFKLHELPELMGRGESLDHNGLLQKLDLKQVELEQQITRLQSSKHKITQLKLELSNSWSRGACTSSKRLAQIFEDE